MLGAWLYAGCYDIEGYDFKCTGVFTNNTPTDAYRGAGRPEATYAIERAMDALARKLGRTRSSSGGRTSSETFPTTIASGLTVDSGDYEGALDKRARACSATRLRREQAERRERGDKKLLGIGFST